MITVRFLSGLERRLGLSEKQYIYEGPTPVSFRSLCEKLHIHGLESIKKPLLINCIGETFTLDEALSKLEIPDRERVIIFMINGGG